MNSINNLKQIREIYGATQEQIARALSVNRVTVANWESGSTVASSANREKMSMYYGIGPEFFYEQALSEEAKQQIMRTAERERAVVSQSEGHKNKQEDFQKMFRKLTFDRVMQDYMLSMKMLLRPSAPGKGNGRCVYEYPRPRRSLRQYRRSDPCIYVCCI